MVKSGQIRYWTPAASFENERARRFDPDFLVVVLEVSTDEVRYTFVTAPAGSTRYAKLELFEAMTDVYF